MNKKLKTRQEILEWFGDKRIGVHEVLERTDNRIMFGMYNKDILSFDSSNREYYVTFGGSK